MMLGSIYAKTIRDNRKGLFWWGLGIIVYGLFLVSFYPEIKDQPGFDELLKESETYQALAGGVESFSSPEGFLNAEAFSIMAPLFLIIYAVGRGTAAIAGEEGRRTLPLLLAQPVSRTRVVRDTFAAMMTGLVVLSVLLWLSFFVPSGSFGLDISAGSLAAAILSVFLLGGFFGGLAFLLGAATGQRGLASGVTAAVALATYLVDTLGKIIDVLEPYRVLSPFYYYYENDPLSNGLDPGNAAILAASILLFFLLSLLVFRRRDIHT